MSPEESVDELFSEAMSSLASGVAIVTTTRTTGEPCGLAATSVSSYSAAPASVLVSIGHSSRCHDALTACDHFGVHILRADEEPVARTFASKSADKFAGLGWRSDAGVPELTGALAYLRCRRSATFDHHDHTLLIGDLEGGRFEEGVPLLYVQRRMDWLLGEPG